VSSGGPKPRTVVVDGRTFERIPIRTDILRPGRDPAEAVLTFAGPLAQPGDTVVISESAVAIMQGRGRDWRTITPGRLALAMSRRVTETEWGEGLRNKYAMQYAIDLIGVPRILAAAVAHVAGRALGKQGWFYLVAGLDARMMDAPCHTGIEEHFNLVIPAPADPRGTCAAIKAATGLDAAICDINDIAPAWCVASTLTKERARLLERSFDDNPLGQFDEQTPIGIWRELESATASGTGPAADRP
jgi:hypothetical protein